MSCSRIALLGLLLLGACLPVDSRSPSARAGDRSSDLHDLDADDGGTDGTGSSDADSRWGWGDGGDGGFGGDGGPIRHRAGPRGLLIAMSWDREDAPFGDGSGQYRYIVLQESMYTILDEVRDANPNALILAYQKGGGMRPDGGDHASTGVSISEAASRHEAWFLHDAAGDRLYYCDYADVAVANIGNVGFQARWLANVKERLTRDGFDGVMIDDINTFPGHCLGSLGTPIAEYATDEDYGDAVVRFMAAVGPALMAEGLVVAPNVAMNPWEDVMREQTLDIVPSTSHIFREYWMRWSDSEVFTGDNWLSTLTLLEEVEDIGCGFLALTYGPGEEGVEAGQRYGRASFLLSWDGVQESAWGYLDDDVDPWSAEWEGDIGRPAGDRTAVGVGWKRAYTRGMVLVNPDDSDSQYFDLGASYVHPDGGTVDAVTLGSGQAVILTAVR